jgi:hypothetical protein
MRTTLPIALVACLLVLPTSARGESPRLPVETQKIHVDLVQIQLVLPGKVKIGKTFQVLDELENAGTEPAFQTTTLYFLSRDNKLDESDVIVGGRRAPQLGATQSHSATIPVTLKPTIEPGVYYFIAMADGKREIEERYKDNNTRAVKITVQPADPPK